ncbi:uncharacterized protein LOC101854434 [Aplysia californica]|uniref:Uncharacterized protein LOC101854434 n=1 Tax=Aplysia californica TaxID=6500 RepID=A0ABM0K0K2_APLCA|nr:uncharacterized protein LOC101854434 [Aplysia californica]
MSGNHAMSRELDQVIDQYRGRLRSVAGLWTQMTQLGFCDVSIPKSTEDMTRRLEGAVAELMEKEVKVERARQCVLNLGLVLDVSRQTVEAKSQHLGQEERQKEEAQTIRFKEFQKIHKLQAEKAAIEKELIPARARLAQVMEMLEEKNEKMRNLEKFHESLSEHCATDMMQLQDRTEDARTQRGHWDMSSTDIGRELMVFPLDKEELRRLDQHVHELKQALHNHRQWHEEELQTKLFLSTRSKEIKHRLAYYRGLLRRLERSGRSEDGEEEPEERAGLGRQSDNFLVDGSPGVQAKEVEQYLSHQFGMRVLADYTMLRRLKEEIGVQGLAYLVEKIRLQGGGQIPPNVAHSPSCNDWEERRVQQALLNIALEYREQGENKRLLRVPGLCLTPSTDSVDGEVGVAGAGAGHIRGRVQGGEERMGSPSIASSTSSRVTAHSTATDSSLVSGSSGRRGSNNSLRRKSSLARIKKFLKF